MLQNKYESIKAQMSHVTIKETKMGFILCIKGIEIYISVLCLHDRFSVSIVAT